MNNLAYNARDPQTVAAQVEAIVRKDIGTAGPVPYTVADGSAEPYTFGSALKLAVFGGDLKPVFRLNFELPQPRPARLQVSMDQMGIGCMAGSLLYSARLSKTLGGEVSLEPPQALFRKSKFVGDRGATAKLNSNSQLVKLATTFARTESTMGGATLQRERLLRILPDGNGSVLVIGSLPRTTSMGFSATVDAKDFFEIANLIERSL